MRGYYAALDERRFEDAWKSLSPAVRTSFGGFDHWRDGYARTLSSRPSEIAVEATTDGATVEHVLIARDRGCPQRRFEVTWRLRQASGEWSVTELGATAADAVRCP